MQFYKLSPMYGGDCITSTIEEIDGERVLTKLGFEIDEPIESIVKVTCGYAVSSALKSAMVTHGLTGIRFSTCEITPSLNFIETEPSFPEYFHNLEYFQLLPVGRPFIDDVSLREPNQLLVSRRALALIKESKCGDIEFEPIKQ